MNKFLHSNVEKSTIAEYIALIPIFYANISELEAYCSPENIYINMFIN